MDTVKWADALGITERTVNFHFSKILRKLSAINRIESVAKGVELGLIKPLGLNGTTAIATGNASAYDEYTPLTCRWSKKTTQRPEATDGATESSTP